VCGEVCDGMRKAGRPDSNLPYPISHRVEIGHWTHLRLGSGEITRGRNG
jgi:hypothetical protein